jgi:hypothetical protein
MMVRVTRFHSRFTSIGITGWMLRMFCLFFCGPYFRFVLFWNGTLIKAADRILGGLREFLGRQLCACRRRQRRDREHRRGRASCLASCRQLEAQRTSSISLGRHCLVKNGSSGLYRRRMVNQPLPGIVWIQLPRLTPSGCVGLK